MFSIKNFPTLKTHKTIAIIVIVLYLLSLTKSLYTSRLGFGLVDEGENVHNGLRIINGEIPYRDFFAYLPPLKNTWAAFAFKFFGVNVYAPRLLSSLIFSFFPPLVFLLARRFTNLKYALIPAILLVFAELNMERLYYYSFIFAGFYLFVRDFKSDRKVFLLLSGLLIGIGSMIRLDAGGIFFLGLSLGTLIYGGFFFFRKVIPLFMIGFTIPFIILLNWLVRNNIVEIFLKRIFINPYLMTKVYSLPMPSFFNIFPKNITPQDLFRSYETIFLYTILSIYIIFFVYLYRNWKKVWTKNFELGTLSIIGILLMPYMLGRGDMGHFIKGGIPAFILGTYLISKNNKFKVITASLMFTILCSGIAQVIWATKFYDTKLTFDTGSIFLNSSWPKNSTLISADTINSAIEFVKSNTNRDEQFLALPYMAGLYFLSGKTSPMYYDNVFFTYLSSETDYLNNLKSKDIKVVIYDPLNGPPSDKKSIAQYYPRIHDYIITNYEIVTETQEGWLFMKKK